MITLYVCLNCDRDPVRLHAPEAEGRGWFKTLKKALAGHEGVQVKSVNCLGGCECTSKGVANGCCSVGLMAPGKFGFVLNQFLPGQDDGKIMEFLRRYAARKDGRLGCHDEPDLNRHVATRLPAAVQD